MTMHFPQEAWNWPIEKGLEWARIQGDQVLRAYMLGRVRGSELANMKYRDYLRSAEWWSTRAWALHQDDTRCAQCGTSHKLQVHHAAYDHRGAERLDELAVLCDECHGQEHNKP